MQRQPSTAAALSISRKLSFSYIADDDDDRPVPVLGAWDRSLDDVEAGFSRDHGRPRWNFFDGYRVKGSPRYHEEEYEMTRREPYFLDSCFLCNKPLRNSDDLFMYRGDTPFCSEECRQEQIELDQQREMNLNLSSTVRTMRNKGQRHQQEQRSASPSKSPNPHLRKGTVAVA